MSSENRQIPDAFPRTNNPIIVVIGGGITGLSAAYRLVELSREKNLNIEIHLLEGSNKLGGVISTQQINEMIVEEGPDSFITTKPWALSLCSRIGIESRIINTNNENRRTFVVNQGKLIPVPDGFLMLAPTSFIPFILSPLFSWTGKLRTLMEVFIPRKSDNKDESLASFVKRRFGREILERIAQPLISGIYTADPETLSLKATFPQFLEMESRYRSVIKALIRERQSTNRLNTGESGVRYNLFASFKDGMKTLVDTLYEKLPKGNIKLNKHVTNIQITHNGWRVNTKDGEAIAADGVIIATPAHQTSDLIKGVDSYIATELSKIRYGSATVINLAYRREHISHPLDGFGFVTPSIEKRPVLACSFSSIKFKGRSPEEIVLLRCFMGGALSPHDFDRDKNWHIKTAHEELRNLIGIKSEPIFAKVSRHPLSMPQYKVGHLELISDIKDRVNKYPSLQIAGNAYYGVGIPDCIHSGESSAENIVEDLLKKQLNKVESYPI